MCYNFLCGECFCAPCFRKKYASVNEHQMDWRLYFHHRHFNEISFLFLGGVEKGVCSVGHRLQHCTGFIFGKPTLTCDTCRKHCDPTETSTYWSCRSHQCNGYTLCESCYDIFYTADIANSLKQDKTFIVKKGE